MTRFDLRAEAAEAIGAFLIVLLGCGAILSGSLDGLAISFAFGATVCLLVYAFGHVSGAHFNPAVTLAFAAIGRFPWTRVANYIAAQTIGAIAAALVLAVIFSEVTDATTVPSLALPQAILVEVAITFTLMLTIVAFATDKRVAPGFAGLAIGAAIFVGALVADPLTGGSMNPARSLGPALASSVWDSIWLYLIAPPIGALLGAFAYESVRGGLKPKPNEAQTVAHYEATA